MAGQLTLLDTPTWRIDEATREAGRLAWPRLAALEAAVAARRAREAAEAAREHPSHGRSAA